MTAAVPTLTLRLIGERGARGRFTTTSHTINERTAGEMAGALREILALYREQAPKSKGDRSEDRPLHFFESFTGDVVVSPIGVDVTIVTSQGQLRDWLRQGTAAHDILPKAKKALAFEMQGDQVVVRSVHHPGTKPNHWEDPVELAANELVRRAGNKVAARVVAGLAG